jgi:CheY-like chemotaxis protein
MTTSGSGASPAECWSPRRSSSSARPATLPALRQVGELRPDVVLLDVQLPDGNGFEVARGLAELPDPPRVVLVSGRGRTEFGGLVERSEVCGFIGKAELTGALLWRILDEAAGRA